MKKQYLYISDMDDKDYDKYLDKLSGLDTDEHLNVIIDTCGGESALAEILIKEISGFKSYSIDVKMTQSAGFDMLDMLHEKATEVTISRYGQYMVHLSSIKIYMGQGGIPMDDYNKYLAAEKGAASIYEYKILTLHETGAYENGNDIYISTQRMINYYSKTNKDAKGDK